MLQPVTSGGLFTEEVTDFTGQFVKDADPGIIMKLKEEGKLYKKETIVHSYPFQLASRRCSGYLLCKRIAGLSEQHQLQKEWLNLNKTINWQPPEVGSGRFGNWLEENKDWAFRAIVSGQLRFRSG